MLCGVEAMEGKKGGGGSWRKELAGTDHRPRAGNPHLSPILNIFPLLNPRSTVR